MAVSVQVSASDRGVSAMLTKALQRSGDLSRPMTELGLFMVRAAGRRLRLRTTKSDDSTGALRASLTFREARDQVTVGSNLVYAAVQQLGDTIMAKPPLKRIAIPLLPNLRRRHIWPRDLPKGLLHLIKNDRGQLILMGPKSGIASKHEEKVAQKHRKRFGIQEPKESDEVPWFLLVEKSKVPPRPYIVFDNEAKQFLRRRLIKHLGLKEL